MNCNETFDAGICYVTDAYKRVCKFNEELHADIEECQSENSKLRELVHDMGFLIAWADWNTVEDDERAYQLVCRAEEMGIEVHQ